MAFRFSKSWTNAVNIESLLAAANKAPSMELDRMQTNGPLQGPTGAGISLKGRL